jgi:hypothetical protein
MIYQLYQAQADLLQSVRQVARFGAGVAKLLGISTVTGKRLSLRGAQRHSVGAIKERYRMRLNKRQKSCIGFPDYASCSAVGGLGHTTNTNFLRRRNVMARNMVQFQKGLSEPAFVL